MAEENKQDEGRKLYVFCIGGTGSRVMRSLVMLLAAGAKIDVDTIVPIIIDPDGGNGDLAKTLEVLEDYNKLSELTDDNCGFFKTKLKNLFDEAKPYVMSMQKATNVTFGKYINEPQITDDGCKALVDILFEKEHELDGDMNVGFKGHPNIGSVVLNQFSDPDFKPFKDFANDFQDNDGIFIISSIFGGTGASGFPLLLKSLRNAKGIKDFPKPEAVSKAPIGGVTVLPYFELEHDENGIDSAGFNAKTKAALSYYENNLDGEINNLYYIGDGSRLGTYKNNSGGNGQKDTAHFVELASALSIVDFAGGMKDISNKDNITSHYFEFGIEKDDPVLEFDDFCDVTNDIIKFPLTQFTLFGKYFNRFNGGQSVFDAALKSNPQWYKNLNLGQAFVSNVCFKNLLDFIGMYFDWLEELGDGTNGRRSFAPFDLTRPNNAFEFVKGQTVMKLHSLRYVTNSNYDLYDTFLNEDAGKVINMTDAKAHSKDFNWQFNQMLNLFYASTERLVTDKIGILRTESNQN
jgi:hypothetical protein